MRLFLTFSYARHSQTAERSEGALEEFIPLTRQFILNENTPFVVNETYAKIRTNILSALDGSMYNSFVVTSQCRSEGKTTSAVNLSIMFSRLGKRVLLIDCDLRRSCLADMLRIKNRFGLSSILTGECDVYSGICADVRTDFHVITSGPFINNPSELLGGGNMERLVRMLYDYYDYIVLDTPPLCIANDAVLFGGYTGGVILVLRENKTTHKDMKTAVTTLKLSKARVLGVIKTYCAIKTSRRDEYKSTLAENAADLDERDLDSGDSL